VGFLIGEKVLIGPSSFAELDSTPLDRLVQTGCEVICNPFKRKISKSELRELLSCGVTGLIAGLEPIDRDVMGMSRLKAISRCGSGLSNVDLTVAKELGIQVCSTPDGPTTSVAELTLGVMLSMIRGVFRMNLDLHNGKWSKGIGAQLEGKTVVIIGFGRIGQRLAALMEPFKTRVLVVDPYLAKPMESFEVLPIEEALRQADIITIHCSGDACILGEREFDVIKPGAFLLNAARGGLIDESVLVRAMDQGRIAGAWIDTFAEEPYIGPLCRYPQVILTPHVGSYTRECRQQMEMEAVDNLIGA